MAKTFRCKLVTPTAALIDEPVVYASVPMWDGLMGFQPGRAPILGRLGLGELRLDLPSGSRTFLVEDGFAKMANDQLTVIAERATPAENITATEAEAELKTASAITDQEKRNKAHARAAAKLKLAKR